MNKIREALDIGGFHATSVGHVEDAIFIGQALSQLDNFEHIEGLEEALEVADDYRQNYDRDEYDKFEALIKAAQNWLKIQGHVKQLNTSEKHVKKSAKN